MTRDTGQTPGSVAARLSGAIEHARGKDAIKLKTLLRATKNLVDVIDKQVPGVVSALESRGSEAELVVGSAMIGAGTAISISEAWAAFQAQEVASGPLVIGAGVGVVGLGLVLDSARRETRHARLPVPQAAIAFSKSVHETKRITGIPPSDRLLIVEAAIMGLGPFHGRVNEVGLG